MRRVRSPPMHCVSCGTELPAASAFCPGCGQGQRPKVSYSGGVAGLSVGFIVAIVLLAIGVVAFLAVVSFGPSLINSGRSGTSPPLSRIVIDTQQVLKDGSSIGWKLQPGNYHLDMTASDDGATVEWIGGNCPSTQPMRQLATNCEMKNEGQLIIKNPTSFGLGSPVSVTIK